MVEQGRKARVSPGAGNSPLLAILPWKQITGCRGLPLGDWVEVQTNRQWRRGSRTRRLGMLVKWSENPPGQAGDPLSLQLCLAQDAV